VKNRFQSLPFKCNLQRYIAAGSASDLILFAYVYSVTERGAYQAVTGAVGPP
jgi:hypothetical protein